MARQSFAWFSRQDPDRAALRGADTVCEICTQLPFAGPNPVQSLSHVFCGAGLCEDQPRTVHRRAAGRRLPRAADHLPDHRAARRDPRRGAAGARASRSAARTRAFPSDESNTCWRVAERVMKTPKARGKVAIPIEKSLPVQGGIGGGSSNAVATLLGLERGAAQRLAAARSGCASPPRSAPICRCSWSAAPCWACGRGEEVYPLPDLPAARLRDRDPAVRRFDAGGFRALGRAALARKAN